MPKNPPPNQNKIPNTNQPKQIQQPIAPPPPQQKPIKNNPDDSRNGTSKNYKFLLFSIAAVLFVLIVTGITIFIYSQDQELQTSGNPNRNEESQTNSQQPTLNQNAQAPGDTEDHTPNADEICIRFTNLENALDSADQACALDLSNQNLTSIPEEIYDLPNLSELDLSNNNLSEFPFSVLQIEALTTLSLKNNNISSIPENIEIPNNIIFLDLSGNNLNNSTMENYHSVSNSPASSSEQ